MRTRFWRWPSLAVILGTSGLAFGAAPPMPNPAAPTYTAADTTAMTAYVNYYVAQLSQATTTRAMVRARHRILKPLQEKSVTASVMFLSDYGSVVTTELTPLLAHKNLALNAIITLANIKDLSTQPALQQGLESPIPAVRYWSARGLIGIEPELAQIGPSEQSAVTQLKTALSTETDPVAALEMCQSLQSMTPEPLDTAPLIVAVLGRVTQPYPKAPPQNLDIAAQLATSLTQLVKAGAVLTPDQKLAAMTTLADLCSYAAQYWQAGLLGYPQKLAAPEAINACSTAMNAVSGSSSFAVPTLTTTSSATESLLKVNALTGSQSQAGVLQKLFPKAPIPVRIAGAGQ